MRQIIMMINPLLISFLTAAILGPVFIPWLRRLKFGQEIRDEGPSWHKKKSGTPTMGGLMIWCGVILAMIIALIIDYSIHTLMLLLTSLGFGLIGFLDDYIKVVKKRNLGLTALQKFVLQCALALAYVLVLKQTGELSTTIVIPFTSWTFDMPWQLYIPFIIIVVAGTVNAVNLTDGLDGLASSVTTIASLFFAAAAMAVKDAETMAFAMAVAGGCAAFLIYNHYPAKVFMGDTGSLFLGGAISVMAIGMGMPLILVIAGFVYLFEALSVILQVASFKLTGKRIFKMSPVHHHFEMCGWSEKKIVFVFSAVTLILCIAAYFAIMPYAASLI